MIIHDILKQLESSTHPVAKAIHKGEHFKVLALAFKKGMTLKEHITTERAKLTVLSGAVIYRQDDKHQLLHQYDEVDIPINIMHSVECIEDAVCLLTQGQ